MAVTTPNRVYQDFEPPSDLISEQDCDTILVHLPGFKRDQLRVQLTTARILKVSGERPIGENKWKRFLKEFRLTPNCNTKEITAKLEGGILYIRQPKLPTTTTTTATPASPPKSAAPPQQTPPPPPPPPPTPPPQSPKAENGATRKEKHEAEIANKVGERLRTATHELSTVKRGLFTELRKPANLKRLAVCVVMAMIVGGLASYFFNSYTGEEQQNLMQYDLNYR